MPDIDPAGAVRAAYEYLIKVTPEENKKSYSAFRVEEIQTDENGNYSITLSYDVAGQFGFDTKKEYKIFTVLKDGTVTGMKIKTL